MKSEDNPTRRKEERTKREDSLLMESKIKMSKRAESTESLGCASVEKAGSEILSSGDRHSERMGGRMGGWVDKWVVV